MNATWIRIMTCTMVALAALASQANRAGGAERVTNQPPVRAAELAAEFSKLVSDLEGSIGGDPADLLDQSADLQKKVLDAKRNLNAGFAVVTDLKGSLEAHGKRIVDQDQLIPLVQALGEVSMRLNSAEEWAKYSTSAERIKVRGAQLQAKAMNQAEIERAYAEYVGQVQGRQAAMYELWGIVTGRREVVVAQFGTGGLIAGRPATFQEALGYMSNLEAFARSAISVRPPQRTRPRDIHPINELQLLEKELKTLSRLCEYVDAELEQLAKSHTKRLEGAEAKDLARGHLVTIASVGWWNGKAGWDVVLANLDRPTDSAEHLAALGALDRMRCNEKQLKTLVTHRHADVRSRAIRIAANRLQAAPDNFRVLREAMQHDDGETRSAAYEALPRQFELARVPEAKQPDMLAAVFESRKAPVILDAIAWLKEHTTFQNRDAIKLFKQQAANKRHPELQVAANAALESIGAAGR